MISNMSKSIANKLLLIPYRGSKKFSEFTAKLILAGENLANFTIFRLKIGQLSIIFAHITKI